MIVEAVVAQHVEESVFLWGSRARAAGAPHHTLRSLAALDERLEAHLDGLRIAGDAGWTLCRQNVQNTSGAEIFPLGVLAFGSADRARMLDALTLACTSSDAGRGLVSALGWLEPEAVRRWIDRLLQADRADHRLLGVAASAVHRVDPGERLAASVGHPNERLRMRALRAVGELGRADLAGAAHEQLSDANASCRFWAAWSLALLGNRAGLVALSDRLTETTRFGRLARTVAIRAMSLEAGRDRVRAMVKEHGQCRATIEAAAAVGDPAIVPWLIEGMANPQLARVSGEAFTCITGVSVAESDLEQTRMIQMEEADEPGASEAGGLDEGLAEPDQTRVGVWWRQHRERFQLGARYLGGLALTPQSAQQVLKAGTQRLRAAAAVELRLRGAMPVLFEVRAPAVRQQKLLR